MRMRRDGNPDAWFCNNAMLMIGSRLCINMAKRGREGKKNGPILSHTIQLNWNDAMKHLKPSQRQR